MEFENFVNLHRPALEEREVENNLMLGILNRQNQGDLRLWTIGGPGAAAVQTPGRPLCLGSLSEAECHRFADTAIDLEYPGVVGSHDAPQWFVGRAIRHGFAFEEPIPMEIQAIHDLPSLPDRRGEARPVALEDGALFADWSLAFLAEAVPHDPRPPREQLEQQAGDGRYLFWVVNNEPVAMAGIVRRTRNAAAIGGVYTTPPMRGRGYAGSVTAALVHRIFAEGKTAACLYTDLRNPFSNRCYAKIGFKAVCRSWHINRQVET